MQQNLLDGLANKTVTKTELLKKAIEDQNLIPALIDGTSSSKASIRYGCSSVLMELSSRQPEQLYQYWNKIVELLDSNYRILIWNAMAVIANLTWVDTEKKFEGIFDKYYCNLNSEYMVTVANLVGNSATIGLAKPYLAPKIAAELLKVENLSLTPHLTEECKRVIAEHAIKTFDTIFDYLEDKEQVVNFVKRQLDSPRASLKREAEKFNAKRKIA
jgi:hypothetical protein